MKSTKTRILFATGFSLLLLVFLVFFLRKDKIPPKEPVDSRLTQPIDDAFWIGLDRRRSDKFREQLRTAPQVLVVRESHYPFNPTNGMGMHYGWLDGRLADLGISVSELVGYGYNARGVWDWNEMTRTEFPTNRGVDGYMTNKYDVIVTITNHPREAMQAEIKKLLKQQFGLTWHRETKSTEVLLLKVKDQQVLRSKVVADFAQSRSIPELATGLGQDFGKPVIDETGVTNRFDKRIELVPAYWANGQDKDLTANNTFLSQFGLELVPEERPQEWLVMDRLN